MQSGSVQSDTVQESWMNGTWKALYKTEGVTSEGAHH